MLKKLGSIAVLAAAVFALSASAGEFVVHGKAAESIIAALQDVGAQKSFKKNSERVVASQFTCSTHSEYFCGQNNLVSKCSFSQTREGNSKQFTLGDRAASSLFMLLSREGLNVGQTAPLHAETLTCVAARGGNEASCILKFAVRN